MTTREPHSSDYFGPHVHSEYSSLDGLSTIDEIVDFAFNDGHKAVCITDHGNLSAFSELYKKAKATDIMAIPAMEAYVKPPKEFTQQDEKIASLDGDAGAGKAYHHLIIGAYSAEGYRNLSRLSSASFREENYYYKPRLDFELLDQYSEGIYLTTACLGGVVQTALLKYGSYELAREYAARYADIVGKEHLYIELADHGILEQRKVMPDLLRIADDLGLRVIAASDSHYSKCDHTEAHDAWLCQGKTTIHDENRWKFPGAGNHYLHSEEDMKRVFSEIPQAIYNCAHIVESAQDMDLSFLDDKPKVPTFTLLPPRFNDDTDYLIELVNERRPKFYPELTQEVSERIDYEIKTISELGFSGYFLIVQEYVNWAKDQGILVGPARGSGAGSIIAYILGITTIDPLPYNLLFDRFLHSRRASIPDFDVDFPRTKRELVIDHIKELYGVDNVVGIGTFMTVQSRNALLDSARKLGFPVSVGRELADAQPPTEFGKSVDLKELLDEDSSKYELGKPLRTILAKNPEYQQIVDTALVFHNKVRGTSQHPCGFVIADDPIADIVPTMTAKSTSSKEKRVVTQFDEHGAERASLVKFDLLGLKTLDVIQDCIDQIREATGNTLDLYQIPFDDDPTFELYKKAQTVGVFQVEGTGVRQLLRDVAPDNIEAVADCLALYRPGPMGAGILTQYVEARQSGKPAQTFHPDADEILASSSGLMIMQEDIMRITQKFAGFDLAEADLLRRAVGKKLKHEMVKFRGQFVQGCIDSGYDEELGNKIFDAILPAADYSFTKGHAIAYAILSYWMAYLKAHHPVEFMAALLKSVEEGDESKKALYLSECKQLGIDPDDIL